MPFFTSVLFATDENAKPEVCRNVSQANKRENKEGKTLAARKRMVLVADSSRLPSQRHSNASCKVQTICELQFHVNGVPRPCHKVTLYRVPRQRGRPRHERGLRRSANHEFDSWKRDAFTFVPGCTGKMKSTRTIAAPCLRFASDISRRR